MASSTSKERRGKANVRKINSGLMSARAGQSSEIRGESREGLSVTGSQKPDPGAGRRKSWTDDRYTTWTDDRKRKGAPAKDRISKKKPKTEHEYDAKKKLEKDKTPQGTPTFNTNPKGKKASKNGHPSQGVGSSASRRQRATAKPKPSAASAKPSFKGPTAKKASDYTSQHLVDKDAALIKGNPTKKKKKRKAPTYRG